jgi:VWFA-related protein
MMRPWLRSAPLLAILLCVTGHPAAQSTNASSSFQAATPQTTAGDDDTGATQQPTFRERIDSVTVDVSVTDKQGQPVTDLTADDFEIRESGKVQKIDAFQLIRTNDGRDDPDAMRDISSLDDQKRETARLDNRLFVIYLDDYHVRVGNSVGIREQLARFVRELTPHDLVAIMRPLEPAAALTFSRDHDGAANDILAFKGRKYNYQPTNALEAQYAGEPAAEQEQLRNGWVVGDLTRLADAMGSLREGRKTILYVSEGMSGTLPPGATTFGSSDPITTTITDPTQRDMSSAYFNGASLLGDMQMVFRSAARSNVAIYTVDPRGLTQQEFSLADHVSDVENQRTLNESLDLLKVTAEQTNGRAITGRNNVLPQLAQMVRDNSTYYLMTYVSSLAPRDGKFHEIDVRVRRKGVEVRARKGYWALSPEEIERVNAPARPGPSAAVMQALDAMSTAAESSRRHAITVWSGSRPGATEKASVTVAWEATTDTPDVAFDRVDHVVVTATGVHGEPIFEGTTPPKTDVAGRVSGQATFDAPAGAVHVRVEAMNAAGRRVETDESDLDVPDYSTVGATITTPFVYSGRSAFDLQKIRAMDAPVPATDRTFARTEQLLIRFDAYGPAGTTPAVTMRLLNSLGTSIATLPPPSSTGPHAYESTLPLGSFPPGDYLIEIGADAGGSTASKLLAIRVTG